mmetsp:Transcript_25689/g.64825  ORF Transcript_25689/g.64825 Transcript_25689/m.64825 type:complete len:208 (+) Transcript_25689:159-782(+)
MRGRLDLVEHLALALAGLQVAVPLLHVVQLEGAVHRHLQAAVLQPAKDVVGALQQLLARDGVVVELWARQEGGLADELEWGEGGHGAAGVAKAHEDAALAERVERDLPGVQTDAVNDTLDAVAVSGVHHLLHNVCSGVVLVAGAGGLLQHNQLVHAGGTAHSLLGAGASADDLVPADLRHLCGPLAGAAAHTVDQHPLARLDQPSVR